MLKFKTYISNLIIFTLPFMTVISVHGSTRFNTSVSDIFLCLFILAVFISLKSFKLKENYPYWWYFLGLLLIMLVQFFVLKYDTGINRSSIIGTASEAIKFFISSVYLFFGYNFINKENSLYRFSKIWSLSTLAVFVIGIIVQVSAFLGKNIDFNTLVNENRTRFLGTLTDANLAALYLTFSFFIALVYGFQASSRKDYYLSKLSLFASIIAIILTFSRGGMLGFAAGILLYSVLNIKNLYRKLYLVPVLFAIFTIILNIDTNIFKSTIYNTLTTRIELALNGQDMFKARLNTSLAAIKMGRDHFILGVGRGNFPLNSKKYLVDQGVDWKREGDFYKNLIPHNTLAGFFAEMGIIGLLMFCSIFALLLYKLVRADNISKPVKYAFYSLFFATLVESIPLNIENFRGLWVLTGVILFLCDKKVCVDAVEKENKKSPMAVNIIKASIMTVLLMMSLFLLFDSARKVKEPADIAGKSYMLTYDVTGSNELTLRYMVNVDSGSKENPLVFIDVYQWDGSSEKLLRSVSYWKASGYGNIVFKPEQSAKEVHIKVRGGSGRKPAKVFDMKIIDGSRVWPIFDDYPLLPSSIYKYAKDKGLLVDNESRINKNERKKYITESQDQYINIADKIIYEGSEVINSADGKVKINIRFKCNERIDKDYILWTHILADDVNNIPEDFLKLGFLALDHFLQVPTSRWEPGREYVDSFVADLKPGNYKLEFGFWIPPQNGEPEKRLFTEDKKAGIDAGWFKVGD